MRAASLLAFAAVVLTGCSSIQRTPPLEVWPDMRHQPKFKPQLSTELYPDLENMLSDGRQTRSLPEGVIARGRMVEENPFTTGMEGNLYVGKIPVPVTEAMIADGQVRFNIYCSPCHDRNGLGRGLVPKHAANWQPANLMEDRVVGLADGDLFNIITFGRRTMPPYAFQTSIQERWNIISYLRVLQRASHGTISDVPEDQRSTLAYKGAN